VLSATWILPALGGVVVCFLPRGAARVAAVLVALGGLALTLVVAGTFDPGHHGYQFAEQASWIPQLSVSYHLGVDGLSVWLLVLNALIGAVAVLATPKVWPRAGAFLGLMLLMEGALAGVFLSVALLLFYVLCDARLIPAYFLLWLCGEGDRPSRASLKFMPSTLGGSLLMMAGWFG